MLHGMTETPAARLLALLELLQARPSASGAELAEALGVTPRSLRRYIQRLVDLGIPVDSERGPYGGYRLRPGYRLPPLMLSPDEAVAVTLGLLMAGRLGVRTAEQAATSALAKLQRVLPDAVRGRVRALEGALDAVPPTARAAAVDPDTLSALATAADSAHEVTLVHHAADGGETRRMVNPYGVVFHAGRWYLVGHDHLRDDLRTFRVDRIRSVTPGGGRFARPADFDAVTHLVRSLAGVPYEWDVEVVLHTTLDVARRLVPPTVGTLEAHPDGALLRIGAVSPDWAARHLTALGVAFTVRRPDELRAALRRLADELRATADA